MARLELFNENIFVLAKRKTWAAIYSIDQKTSFPNLRADYESFEQACYFAKLIDQITPELDQNIPLYTLFYNSLSLLNHGQNPKNVREYFQINTLKIEGLLAPEQKKITEEDFIKTIQEYSGRSGRDNVRDQESKISRSLQK